MQCSGSRAGSGRLSRTLLAVRLELRLEDGELGKGGVRIGHRLAPRGLVSAARPVAAAFGPLRSPLALSPGRRVATSGGLLGISRGDGRGHRACHFARVARALSGTMPARSSPIAPTMLGPSGAPDLNG